MPKVQVYLKHAVIDEIKSLVAEDIQAGAHPEEVSFSSKAATLLELGLRVHNLRRSEHAGAGRDDYDKALFQNSLESKILCQFIMKSIAEKDGVDVKTIREKVDRAIEKGLEPFFQSDEE